jgi:hypothetical protein
LIKRHKEQAKRAVTYEDILTHVEECRLARPLPGRHSRVCDETPTVTSDPRLMARADLWGSPEVAGLLRDHFEDHSPGSGEGVRKQILAERAHFRTFWRRTRLFVLGIIFCAIFALVVTFFVFAVLAKTHSPSAIATAPPHSAVTQIATRETPGGHAAPGGKADNQTRKARLPSSTAVGEPSPSDTAKPDHSPKSLICASCTIRRISRGLGAELRTAVRAAGDLIVLPAKLVPPVTQAALNLAESVLPPPTASQADSGPTGRP